ncbi:MAG: hypothetical protein ABIN97_09190 [Ginsengibacter sp.]
MKLSRLIFIPILICTCCKCFSQQDDSTQNKITFPQKYYSKVDGKLTSISDKLTKKSLKYLAKFQKQEKKLQERLSKLNADATDLFASSNKEYTQLIRKIKSKTANTTGENGQYIPYLDTLSTSLSFLKQFQITGNKVTKSQESLNTLKDKLQQSEKVKEFITQRKQQVKDVLSKYTKLPAGLKKEYARLSKTAYYYSAQVNEYKEMLKDPSKAERKALSLLNKLPAFQKFLRKNSQLASLFRLPDGEATSQSLAGLQTRASVQGLIQQRISAGGPNAQQIIQQNIAQAKSELDKLKQKLLNSPLGDGGDMPDFKPNSQKTKSFLKRLEYGTNVQFAKSNNQFPSTTDLGLSLGYKLNNKSVIGVGMSYKMGMGTIQHIVISHQGIGLRSYADRKLKGSVFISGGYEMNHNAAFKNIEQLKNYNAWQKSGLIGLSKKYSVGKKIKGEMKLLYDFLANAHSPVTQPVLFRLGYSIK